MPDQPRTITRSLDLSPEAVQRTLRTALSNHVETILADIGVAYNSRVSSDSEDRGVRVSVNIDYDFQILETSNYDPLRNQITRYDNAEVALQNINFSFDVYRPVGGGTGLYNVEDPSDGVLSAAMNSLGWLPHVRPDELPEDSQRCLVCHERFSAYDRPVVLKCNHVVGRTCIQRWIRRGHNSCPMCRAAIFEPVVPGGGG